MCCITAGAPFWIGGEFPLIVVRPNAPNREVRTVMVRYDYMYRATPNIYICIYDIAFFYFTYVTKMNPKVIRLHYFYIVVLGLHC